MASKYYSEIQGEHDGNKGILGLAIYVVKVLMNVSDWIGKMLC